MSKYHRGYWPVQTFDSKTDIHYNKAIAYYETREKNFVIALKNQIDQSIYKNFANIQSIEDLLNARLSNIDQDLYKGWSQVYKSKFKYNQLNIPLNKWNQQTKALNLQEINVKELINLVNYLNATINHSGNLINVTAFNTKGNNAVISTDALWRLANMKLSSDKGAFEYGGQRGQAFGEIYETLITTIFEKGYSDIMHVMGIGDKRTGRSLPSYAPVQGRTDTLLSVNKVILDDKSDPSGFAFGHWIDHNTGEAISINLDASELFDLSQSSGLQKLSKFTSGLYTGVGGISTKQWTSDIIFNTKKSASSSQASFGNFALTAKLANKRSHYEMAQQKKISQVFKDAKTFTKYTGYLVSRYLINVIGLLNLFLATGNAIYPISGFLSKLRNYGNGKQYVIAHKQSRQKLGDKEGGNYYIASPSLVIAYTNPTN